MGPWAKARMADQWIELGIADVATGGAAEPSVCQAVGHPPVIMADARHPLRLPPRMHHTFNAICVEGSYTTLFTFWISVTNI
jgi:hypothetical protein